MKYTAPEIKITKFNMENIKTDGSATVNSELAKYVTADVQYTQVSYNSLFEYSD